MIIMDNLLILQKNLSCYPSSEPSHNGHFFLRPANFIKGAQCPG